MQARDLDSGDCFLLGLLSAEIQSYLPTLERFRSNLIFNQLTVAEKQTDEDRKCYHF